MRETWIFQRRGEAKRFPKEASTLLRIHILCFLSRAGKNLLRLDHTDNRGVTFLRIFPCRFFNGANVIFPLQHTILQPIMFGLVIPNKTAKIMCQCKPYTRDSIQTIFHFQYYSVAQSEQCFMVWGNTHDPGRIF